MELYEQAAAAYKLNDNWSEASGALLKVAEILEKQKDSLGAANKYVESGLCMAREDNSEAIKLLEMGIAIHTGEARLGAAARVWKELAQLQEDEEQTQEAINAWRKAVGQSNTHHSNHQRQCRDRTADVARDLCLNAWQKLRSDEQLSESSSPVVYVCWPRLCIGTR